MMGINTPGATWVQTWETTGAEGFRRIPAPEAREIPPPARSSSLRLGIMCFSESEAGRAGAGGQAGAQAPPCSPESCGFTDTSRVTFSRRTLFWFVAQQYKRTHQPSPKIDYSCCALPRNKYSKTFLNAAQSCDVLHDTELYT